MKTTPAMLIIGGLMVFWASTVTMVFYPAITWDVGPSDIWRPWTTEEEEGHRLYVENGCSYCHSLYIRINDWDIGSKRIAEPGDYFLQRPAILGTERTGPDLSQEAGEHPDDWHITHFINPRFVRPVSLMPNWEFLGPEKLRKLTAYMQSLGGKDGDVRVERQKHWKQLAVEAYQSGPDKNIEWLHSQVPDVWLNMPNPYPATRDAIMRGQVIYQEFCINCHGPMGDGQGRAAPYLMPPPLDFTTLRRHLVRNKYIGGLLYYQVMNGITGTAMQYFKKDLESEKIWDVSNYIAVSFVGYSDANIEPRGIDAALEPEWENPYKPPVMRIQPELEKQ